MADSRDSAAAAAGTGRRRLRECAHCPEPDADVCIRIYGSDSGGSGIAIHAHRACAEAHGDTVLYAVTSSAERAS